MKTSKLVLTISLILSHPMVNATPTGAQVVQGSASFSSPSANVLNINNSHNAVINWQSFNIGAGQTTNFIQPSAASSVLNRVISTNPSQILGNLNSNGRVFLINQHGILMGEGASINTAGFFASTLNITDADFLNGNLKFEGGGLGGIENLGYIHTGEGGNIVLIAPNIVNGGVIEVDNGNIILAAGQSITITSLENSSIQFEVSSSDNKVTNLGRIIANQGAASLFAGSLQHSGSIRATGLVRDADGTIRLVASDANRISGTVDASGERGGHIEILGDTVELQQGAIVDASGQLSGGEVFIGGGQQGLNSGIENATSTTVAQGAQVHADATETGNGGRVIVFAANDVHVHGEITAKGGVNGGDGGFIETSGLNWLDITYAPDASAANGLAGNWLIDPNNITIVAGTGFNMTGGPDFTSTGDGAFLDVDLIVIALNNGNNVSVTTGAVGGDAGDINIQTSIVKTGGGDASLTFNAHNDINIGSGGGGDIDITSSSGVMDIVFNADSEGDGFGGIFFDTGSTNSFPITIDTNGGTFSTNTDVVINGDFSNPSSFVSILNSQWAIPGNTSLMVNEDLNIDAPAAVFQNNGEIVIQNLATLDLSGDTLNLPPGSVLSGDGFINGNVDVNGGTIFSGTGYDSFGLLTINGDLKFNSGLLYSVLGVGSGLQSNRITATTATVNGGDLMVAWEDVGVPGDPTFIFDGAKVQLLDCLGSLCLSGTGFNTVINPITVITGKHDLNATSPDALTYELTTLVATPNIVSWTGAGSGDLWSTGNNWSGGATPTSGDYVFLDDVSGTANIQIDSLEIMAGLQSFEAIDILSGGDLTINGDGFILNNQEIDDGRLTFSAANSRLSGAGVLYSGPGAKIDIIEGIIVKDIVNWGGLATTAGNSFQLEKNLVNNSVLFVDQSAGVSEITGTGGTIFNNGILSFGNGGHLSLTDNISLTVTRDTAQFLGAGVFTLDNTAQFDVATTPAIFDTTISLEILGGTFANAHNMNVLPDVIDWYSGVISGLSGADFTLNNGQVLNLFGTADMIFDGGMTLDNNGMVNFLSSGGDLVLNGQFDNSNQLLLNHVSDNADFTGSGVLNNSGGAIQQNSSNNFNLMVALSNNGDINISAGEFIVERVTGLQGGNLDISNGAIFTVGSGGDVMLGSAFGGITGAGDIRVEAGGRFDFDIGPKDISSLQSLTINGGTVENIQDAILPAILNMSSGGMVRGSGNLTIPAVTQVNWNGGALSGLNSVNRLTVDNLATVNIFAGQSLTLAFADFQNTGTGRLTGAGSLMITFNALLTSNNAIDVATIILNGGSIVANNMSFSGDLDWLSGTIGGTGLTTSGQVDFLAGILATDWSILSGGLVNVQGAHSFQSGAIAINSGAVFTLDPASQVTLGAAFGGFTGGGRIVVSSGGLFDFDQGPKDLSSLQSLTINGGRVENIQDAILPSILNMSSGGLIRGAGNLTIAAGTQVNWNGGTLSGLNVLNPLTVNNLGAFDIFGGQSLTLAFTNFQNTGAGSLTGAGTVSVPLNSFLTSNNAVDVAGIILNGGEIVANNMSFSGDLDWLSGTISGTGLTTSGQVDFLAGILATDWTISSGGLVNVQGAHSFQSGAIAINTGAVFTLDPASQVALGAAFGGFSGGGQIVVSSGGLFDFNQGPKDLSSLQSLTINGGTVENIQDVLLPSIVNISSGGLIRGAGNLTIPAATQVNWNGGTLSGLNALNPLTVNNLGAFDIFGGQSLTLAFTNFQNTGTGSLTGAGTVSVPLNSFLTSNNAVDVAGIILNGGEIVANNMLFSGDLDWLSGTISGTGLTTSGQVNIQTGILATDWTFQSGSTQINTGAVFTVDSGGQVVLGQTFSGFTGGGRIIVSSGGLFDFGAGPKDLSSLLSFDINGGAVQNIQDAVLPAILNISLAGLVQGVGNLTIPASTSINFLGDGAISGQDAANLLTVNNQGVINVSSGQTVTLAFADLQNMGTGSLTGPGLVTIPLGSFLTSNNIVDIATIMLNGGEIVANNMSFSGDLDWLSGTISGSGLTTSGAVDLLSGILNTDWLISPTGTVNWTGQDTDQLVINNATITNQGDFNIHIIPAVVQRPADKDFAGSVSAGFINQGMLVIDAGSDRVDFSSLSFDNDGGTIGIQSGTFTLGLGQDQALILDQSTDVLMGFGVFSGNVDNQQGLVTPGRNDPAMNIFQTGTLTIEGNYSQGPAATLAIDMDSSPLNFQHDVLKVTGQLTAGGVIDFNLINGSSVLSVVALIDQSFKPLEFGSFSGRFDQANIPDGLNFTLGPNGFISISGTDNFLDNIETISSQLEVLFSDNGRNHIDRVQAMKFLDRKVRLLLNDDEDEESRAPRLVCK